MQLSFLEQERLTQAENSWFEEICTALGIHAGAGWPDHFGLALRQWSAKQAMPRIRTLSLFSGGGGLDIAFHDAGFNIIEMIEINQRYAETLRKNFEQNSKVTSIDIRNFVPDKTLQIDFIIGGPPCQTFSAAGRRAAGVAGIDDPRGTLFQEYIRLLEHFQPKGFLFENVYGITGAQNGRAWKEIQAAFKSAGYNIFFRVLDAADYGVPQHRERLFIVGLRKGEFLFPYPTHGPDAIGHVAYYTAGAAVQDVDVAHATQGIGGRFGHLLQDIPPGLNYSFYTKEMGHPHPVFSWRSKFSDFLYKADPERPVRTIKAQGGQYTGPFSWENRPFTVAELKRLQTFPDTYEIVGGRQVCIEQIGNSVPPQLGRILALSILDQVIGVTLPFPMHYLHESKVLGFRQRKRHLTELYAIKAQEALLDMQPRQNISVVESNGLSVTQTRFLGRNFSWTNERVTQSSCFQIDFFRHADAWHIYVLRDSDTPPCAAARGESLIEVSPAQHCQWPLGVRLVTLSTQSLDYETFTALWKAFEEKVLAITGIADLVQLSGYYQYQAQIRATMQLSDVLAHDPFWQVVKLVSAGVGVGKQLTGEELTTAWNCEAEKLLDYLLQLREMGFEVRGHKTNPQIPPGEYLIPYIFPTFNPKSVQLRNNLSESYV